MGAGGTTKATVVVGVGGAAVNAEVDDAVMPTKADGGSGKLRRTLRSPDVDSEEEEESKESQEANPAVKFCGVLRSTED
ncbi:unnamed protein product [Symbiodinium natans]|uniref:Uncharacterized protein n=1 Tax=Symbiodinium natans TaxID=878477 RepID=A0A812Q7V5_9DINO|nr:unnamed protein product [Symbiodinium natans]